MIRSTYLRSLLAISLGAGLVLSGCGKKTPVLPDELVKAAHEGDVKALKAQVKQEQALMKDADGNTLLMHAIQGKQSKAVEFLLKPEIGGESIDYCNNEGKTAVYQAIEEGDKELVEQLLNDGADAKFQPKEGSSAIKLAEEKGNQELVDLLKTWEVPEKGTPCVPDSEKEEKKAEKKEE